MSGLLRNGIKTNNRPPEVAELPKELLSDQKQHPKCANPAYPAAFHWTGSRQVLPISARSLIGERRWLDN